MPLRIGFDLDGTLADMEGELIRQAEILFGESMVRRVDPRPATPEINPASVRTGSGTAATSVRAHANRAKCRRGI